MKQLIGASDLVDPPTSSCLDQRHVDLDLIRLTGWQRHGCSRAVARDLRCAHAEVLFPTFVPILCADKYVRVHAAGQPWCVCIKLRRQVLQRSGLLFEWFRAFQAELM